MPVLSVVRADRRW